LTGFLCACSDRPFVPVYVKSVLVLDTAIGSGAGTFYTRCGLQRVGEIPRYALMPGGEMTGTTMFYKFL